MLIMLKLIIKCCSASYLLYFLFTFQVKADQIKNSKPEIQHATRYKAVSDIAQYWVSEKLDGMRGYWDGRQLLTRQGNVIHSPKWFTNNWPPTVMDGELWIARAQFQSTMSCVRKININEDCWRNVRFMIFDIPKHTGTFTQRIKAMENLIDNTPSIYLSMIKQFKLKNNQQLDALLTDITDNKGEGLMVHKGDAYYHSGRSSNIMKLKEYQEAEATIIAHIGGKGKYKGMLGAVTVRTPKGIVFNIGSGFSDKERALPPEIGSIITYKYNGKTKAGIPRFARFFRIRNEAIEVQ
jgi:DNA ligase-1